MTTQKTETRKAGDKPTHFLKVKSEQFGNPLNFTFAAFWEDKEKDYMGVSLNGLKLKPNPNKGIDEPPFHIMLETKIHGQDAEVQIGYVSKDDFGMNLGDMVLFPNNYEERKANIKNQPKP